MAVGTDPIKKPGMERREDLAGKTVYNDGYNLHYDHLGYCVWRENPFQDLYKGTTKSARAQPIEDALAGLPSNENWTGLRYWNHGNPLPDPLTEENEAEYREKYYAELAAEDIERRKKGEDKED